MKGPRVQRTVPPSTTERRLSWKSLLDKPASLESAGIVLAGRYAGPLELHASGAAPIVGDRTEAAAGIRAIYALKRAGVVRANIGVDASDRLALLDAAGTTVLAHLDPVTGWTAANLEATTSAKAPAYFSGANQVVGARGAAVADAAVVTTSAALATADPVPKANYDALVGKFNTLLAETTTLKDQVNAALARLRTHGLIAP